MAFALSSQRELVSKPDAGVDTTLRAHARAALRTAILNGQFVAGQKLVERELCELTGVSRSILREALVHLEVSGLIERESYRGFRVARLTRKKVCDIFELRVSLESQAAELFTERASDAEIANLRQAYNEIDQCLQIFEIGRMRAAKEAYFDVIFTGCRNVEIRRALSIVIDRIHYLRSRLIADPDRRRRSVPEIQRLTDALAARDRLEARVATVAHLESARDAALKLLHRDGTLRPDGEERDVT